MTCHRCSGLLVNDQSVSSDRDDSSEIIGYMGPTARCINCGYLEDPVIRANRLHPPLENLQATPRTRTTGWDMDFGNHAPNASRFRKKSRAA
ncbi:MAG TPA: hypothetical protein VGQ08_01365 [Nitrospiraceae bacterium]|nr:hypothetical protein [Nitrospiraceae bacterium]